MINTIFNDKYFSYYADKESLLEIREKVNQVFSYYEMRTLSTTDVAIVNHISQSKNTRNVRVTRENIPVSEPSGEDWCYPAHVRYTLGYEQLVAPYLLTLIDELLVGNFKHIFNILHPTYVYEDETNIENINRFLATLDTSKLNEQELMAVQHLIDKRDNYKQKESIKPYYDMVRKCIKLGLKRPKFLEQIPFVKTLRNLNYKSN